MLRSRLPAIIQKHPRCIRYISAKICSDNRDYVAVMGQHRLKI